MSIDRKAHEARHVGENAQKPQTTTPPLELGARVLERTSGRYGFVRGIFGSGSLRYYSVELDVPKNTTRVPADTKVSLRDDLVAL